MDNRELMSKVGPLIRTRTAAITHLRRAKARALIELLASRPIIDLESRSISGISPSPSFVDDIKRLHATRANHAQLAKAEYTPGRGYAPWSSLASALFHKCQSAKIDHPILRISSCDISQYSGSYRRS
jgi:hypothetical protein